MASSRPPSTVATVSSAGRFVATLPWGVRTAQWGLDPATRPTGEEDQHRPDGSAKPGHVRENCASSLFRDRLPPDEPIPGKGLPKLREHLSRTRMCSGNAPHE